VIPHVRLRLYQHNWLGVVATRDLVMRLIILHVVIAVYVDEICFVQAEAHLLQILCTRMLVAPKQRVKAIAQWGDGGNQLLCCVGLAVVRNDGSFVQRSNNIMLMPEVKACAEEGKLSVELCVVRCASAMLCPLM